MSESGAMEHTHLISVCVFCLLCATHIHCSEFSSRAIKTKIKSKVENSDRNLGASRDVLQKTEDVFPAVANVETFRSIRSRFVRSASENVEGSFAASETHPKLERNGEESVAENQSYVERLFDKYRTSEKEMNLNGFKKMLKNLRLTVFLSDRHSQDQEHGKIESQKFSGGMGEENDKRGSVKSESNQCLSAEDLMNSDRSEMRPSETRKNLLPSDKRKSDEKSLQDSKPELLHVHDHDPFLTKDEFNKTILKLCPLLLYSIVEPQSCHIDHEDENSNSDKFSAWLYATISVVAISLCGLLGVFVIPIMGNSFYNSLLQFLVALAVGTLCGDALLHLLPHAMIPHDDEEIHAPTVDGHDHDHGHTVTMWKGLAVLLGIVFFFLTEKVLNLGSEWRKKRQRNNKVRGHSHVQIMNGNEESGSVGEKLCKHKYSSYPYCYPDIKSNKDGHEHTRTANAGDARKCDYLDEKTSGQESSEKWSEESQRLTRSSESESRNEETVNPDKEIEKEEEKERKSEEPECDKKDGEYTVIIREHQTVHHGHSHAHGHVHSAPESLSSVAWMVILGDGLHNFTDGMAVGAAFANNIAGGCSTAVAVFCHELPHELGDFAVLLKAGMSAKQAVFYNLMSSILCFIGMCLGIFVGENPQSTSWVFAVSAGMFLYIGLVDMFPELTTSHSAVESSLCQCSLQGLGLISGVSIMLVIAYYEDQLLNLFK